MPGIKKTPPRRGSLLTLFLKESAEGLNTGLTTAQNQGVDVVGAFVGVNRFQVHNVADNVVFISDTVATVHIAGYAGDVQGLATVVTLQKGNGIRGGNASIHHAAQLQHRLQSKGDFSLHVYQLLLDQLVGGQGLRSEEHTSELQSRPHLVCRLLLE